MVNKVVPFLPRALEREVESVLDEAKIWDIDNLGWLNEHDPDPKLIGYAMWPNDQPSIDYNALFGERPVRRRPDDVEKEILTAGEDFCGLMQASRLSIGLALLWRRSVSHDPFNESPFFELHYIDAFIKLAIASDRLRDLLIVACKGPSANIYRKKNRLYVTPYKEAKKLLSDRGFIDGRLTDSLMVLPELAEQLWLNIDRRNKIVHKVATRVALLTRESVSKIQEQYDHEQTYGFSARSDDLAELLSASGTVEEDNRKRLDFMIDELRLWYELLIKAGNHVFQVEYWSRVLGAK